MSNYNANTVTANKCSTKIDCIIFLCCCVADYALNESNDSEKYIELPYIL